MWSLVSLSRSHLLDVMLSLGDVDRNLIKVLIEVFGGGWAGSIRKQTINNAEW